MRIQNFLYTLLFLSVTGTALAEGSVSVREEITIEAPSDIVWDVIADYCAIAAWHPVVVYCDKDGSNTPGTIRTLTLGDGAQITERLVAYDSRQNTYRYEIIDSPLPVSEYVGDIYIRPHGNQAQVVWESSFNSAAGTTDEETANIISGIYVAGLEQIRDMAESLK